MILKIAPTTDKFKEEFKKLLNLKQTNSKEEENHIVISLQIKKIKQEIDIPFKSV